MSDRLTKLPGVLIQRGDSRQGKGSEMFVTNSRQRSDGEPGPRSMCRSLVWLDGVNLGTEFNVNSLDPSIIAAVEWYAGQFVPAKLAVPPRFNAASGNPEPYCGVLVIWLR
jgi:hypothetical protein